MGKLLVSGSVQSTNKLFVGSSSNGETSPGVGIHVWDIRDGTITPNSFGDQSINFYFDQEVDGDWKSIMHIKGWTGDYAAWQIAAQASNGATESNSLYFRTGIKSSWNSWHTLLDNKNYTSYTVTKTGSGASGTWGINVTGSAGSVAWGNVTGKPSTFTPASHTHSGYASIGAHNNLTASGNEFTFASSAFSGVMYVNYRTASGNLDGSISEYRFQNGAGKETAIRCSYMYGTAQAADYATSAGNADSVDGWHSGSFMKVTGPVSSPNTVYDTVASMIQGASGSPSGSQYGAFLTLPYRKTFDNTSPDFAGQIFIPNGDDATTPDGLYYRTSMSTSWRNWKSVIHSCSATYFGGTLPTSGMNTGDVFFKT